MPIIVPRSPGSPPRPRPGWCTWPAPNPSNSVTLPNCGPAVPWLDTCAGRPWRRAIRCWPKRRRRRCTGFWPPHRCTQRKVKYYVERRDPDVESKMRAVLLVYREVAVQNQKPSEGGPLPGMITVSVDEKPAVQAIANVAPDRPPVPGQHPCIGRDYEYKRPGTCSILAALDLHSGHVTARVERRHRSREFILLLKDLDQSYPAP